MRGWDEAVALALALPETAEATSYGEPSLKVGRSLLCRLRVADRSLVLLGVPAEEREMLLEADPDTFFLEDHYRDHDIVLARLDRLEAGVFRSLLERRWRAVAPRRAVRALDGGG